MGNETVPDDSLKGLRVRRNMSRINGRDYDHMIAHFFGMSAIAADDTKNREAASLRLVEPEDDVGAYFALGVAAADRENEHAILVVRLACAQPCREDSFPSFVIS